MKGHFAITLFPSRRNASKTPCASRDPYPWPDSSCGTSVWSRARRLLVGDCERAVAEWHFKPAHCWIVPDTAAASGASRVCLDERRRIVDSRCDPRRRADTSLMGQEPVSGSALLIHAHIGMLDNGLSHPRKRPPKK
jgi:hypothetical protein